MIVHDQAIFFHADVGPAGWNQHPARLWGIYIKRYQCKSSQKFIVTKTTSSASYYRINLRHWSFKGLQKSSLFQIQSIDFRAAKESKRLRLQEWSMTPHSTFLFYNSLISSVNNIFDSWCMSRLTYFIVWTFNHVACCYAT